MSTRPGSYTRLSVTCKDWNTSAGEHPGGGGWWAKQQLGVASARRKQKEGATRKFKIQMLAIGRKTGPLTSAKVSLYISLLAVYVPASYPATCVLRWCHRLGLIWSLIFFFFHPSITSRHVAPSGIPGRH